MMSTPDTAERQALIEELGRYMSEPFLTIAREQCTTAQLRETVQSARDQIADYERMGFRLMRTVAEPAHQSS